MEFTGERYCPHLFGDIAMEHYNRYLFAALIAHEKDVLDIASGEGYGSALLAGVAKSVVGVDIAEEAVVSAAEKYAGENLRFVQGNAAAIPLPDASVDMVVSFETIEHHDRHDDMMREIVRVLRPDGILCLSSPDRTTNSDIYGYNPYHVKELNKQELEELTSAYFARHSIFGQRTLFASLLMQENESTFQSWELEEVNGAQLPDGAPGLKKPKFFVVLATNGSELPKMPSCLLEGAVLQAEIVQQTIQDETNPLKNQNKWLTERNEELEQHTQVLEQYKQELEQHTHVLEQHAHVLEQDKQELEQHTHVLEQDKQELEQHTHVLEQHKQKFEQYNHKLEQKNHELLSETQILHATISDQKDFIASLELEIQEYKHLLTKMCQSRSWKMTKPLRDLGNLLRIVRNKLKETMQSLLFKTCDVLRRTGLLRLSDSEKNQPSEQVQPVVYTAGKPLVVLISGEHTTPGHIYRMDRLAEALHLQCHVEQFPAEDVEQHANIIRAASILWIWRATLTDPLKELIQHVNGAGGKILFDVDDMCFHPSFFDPKLMDAINSQRMDLSALHEFGLKMFRTLELADMVVLTTEQLAIVAAEMSGKPTTVIPNSFDRKSYLRAIRARLNFLAEKNDDIVRIGYAAGSATHQADLRIAVPALAAVMTRHPDVRLVLFRKMVSLDDFTELTCVQEQIEWRDPVALADLPDEVARFDINIAPLEVENPFCQCKSELKYFESALAGIPSVLSATQPMCMAVHHGETGLLADKPEDWDDLLETLVVDKNLRERMGRNARRSVLWTFGPENKSWLALDLVNSLLCTPDAQAKSFVLHNIVCEKLPLPVEIPDYTVEYSTGPAFSRVSVVIPLYNYEKYIVDALHSLLSQTMQEFDVIVVNDASTDNSVEVTKKWLMEHAERFSSVTLLSNKVNSRLSLTRNAGIDYSHSEYIMLLDADNMLLPDCLTLCAEALDSSTAAAAYPCIERFGFESGTISSAKWDPLLFRHGNYVDAMAMLRKSHWIALGGYTRQDLGWEDYDLWCKMIEHGFWAKNIPVVAAHYRVHPSSMLHTITDVDESRKTLATTMNARYNWLRLK